MPLSDLSQDTVPKPPTPEAVLKFPFALGSFVAVISRTTNQTERRRAVELMLTLRGVPPSQASVLAVRMYS